MAAAGSLPPPTAQAVPTLGPGADELPAPPAAPPARCGCVSRQPLSLSLPRGAAVGSPPAGDLANKEEHPAIAAACMDPAVTVEPDARGMAGMADGARLEWW